MTSLAFGIGKELRTWCSTCFLALLIWYEKWCRRKFTLAFNRNRHKMAEDNQDSEEIELQTVTLVSSKDAEQQSRAFESIRHISDDGTRLDHKRVEQVSFYDCFLSFLLFSFISVSILLYFGKQAMASLSSKSEVDKEKQRILYVTAKPSFGFLLFLPGIV